MTGVAALAIFAAFTSCSKNEELYDPGQIEKNEIAQVYNSYNQAFIQTFGQPAANHNWGFKSISAGTRAGAEPTANIWADQGYKAPRELSEGQKLRVKAYFQANPNLTYVDPEWTNFFVQQVYKGGTTPGALSAEVYYTTNGDPITGSERMDHLTFGKNNDGTAKDHVYNYNTGRYSTLNSSDPNGTPRENVQNWPGVTYLTTYTGTDGKQYHKDHIMLMLGSTTECVGFASSQPSLQHNDCMALAWASAIDEWAEKDENKINGVAIGETVVDEWDRCFVGLDYEAMKKDQAYLESRQVAKAFDFMNGGAAYVLYNGQIKPVSEVADFELTDKYGNPVLYVKDNVSNMAVGKKMTYKNEQNQDVDVTKSYYNYNLSKSVLVNTYGIKESTIGHESEQIFDLDRVIAFAKDNCLPTQNNGNWVKDLGGRDYVFSDWIITLSPAEPIDKPNEKVVRIMAEDLNAKANKSEDVIEDDSDWDFNDVVLDVEFLGNDKVEITVVAAGGTLPLRINGEDALEVHELYGQPTNIMINTCRTAALQSKYPNHYNTTTLPKFTRTITGVDADGGRSIKLEVQKKLSNGTEQWFEMTARQGDPAAKFAVKQTVDFCDERQKITSKYPSFGQWVENAGDLVWWNPISAN